MKVYKSIDEQIEILVGRNMHFRSKKFAKRILEYAVPAKKQFA